MRHCVAMGYRSIFFFLGGGGGGRGSEVDTFFQRSSLNEIRPVYWQNEALPFTKQS